MPIPPLQEDGFLPPGLYLAEMDEIENRLRLEEIFKKREPKEAFLVDTELEWGRWIDFFSRVREYLDQRKRISGGKTI